MKNLNIQITDDNIVRIVENLQQHSKKLDSEKYQFLAEMIVEEYNPDDESELYLNRNNGIYQIRKISKQENL